MDIGPAYQVVMAGPIPVPFYLRGELKAKIDGTIGVAGWSDDSGWQLDGTLEPGASGRSIAGVGVASTLSVEGYLGIDVEALWGFPDPPAFREASIALSSGITATGYSLRGLDQANRLIFKGNTPWKLLFLGL